MRTGLYKHYKGGMYQVLGVAQHSNTNELMVVYISLDASLPGPRIRVRPMWGVDGFMTPCKDGIERFEFVEDFWP